MRCERGLSLIELIVFMVIVSVALVGILSVFNQTVGKSAEPMVHKQALAVAEAMMEEILAKDFNATNCSPASCSPNTLADRPNYNGVDHYDGWSQSAMYTLDEPTTAKLAYAVTVAVAATTDLGPAVAKKITVTVSGGGATLSLVGYRANYE